MKRIRARDSERGFILIIMYLVSTVFLILVGAVMAYALAEFRSAQRLEASTQALYLAEAGVDDAIVQLRGDSLWLGGGGAQGTGTYSVAVESLSATRVRLTSIGNSSLLQDPMTRTVEAIVQVTPNPLFQYALFGNQSVALHGNAITDSYDSSKGAYGGLNKGNQGDVGSNAIDAATISLNGNTVVHGNAVAGPSANPNTAIVTTGNAVITGSRGAESSPFVLPPITIPGGLINKGNLSLSGKTTLNLAGGTYWYSSISISGQAKLNFTGPATVYVTGNVSVSGNGVGTASNKPPNLIINVKDMHTVSFSGNGNFYGAVYAPNSSVSTVGNGAMFGAAIGNTVTINGNGALHYDLALRAAVAGSGSQVQFLSWRDLSTD